MPCHSAKPRQTLSLYPAFYTFEGTPSGSAFTIRTIQYTTIIDIFHTLPYAAGLIDNGNLGTTRFWTRI